jgi:hypothetical protein
METAVQTEGRAIPWNKGKLLGQQPPLKLKEILAIRIRLQLDHRTRELAPFNLAIDSKLRGQAVVKSCGVRTSWSRTCKTLPCLRPNGHRSHACDYADKADQGSGGEILSQKCNANGDSDGNPKVSLRCGGHRP